MDAANIATIVVAAIAALSAWASQRAASRASTTNASTSSRVEMEKEAYDRARAYDTETIKRQDAEIVELREDHDKCNKKLSGKDEEIDVLRQRIARLERGLSTNLEEMLRDRLREPDSDDSDSAVQ